MSSGVYCSKLRCLRPVLKKWVHLNKDIAEHWHKKHDVPWWYKERALLSIFSGAVWLSNGIVLEEYSDSKREFYKSGLIHKKTYSGRVDLRFEINGYEFKAEAKHIWLAMTTQKSQKDKLLRCIKRTCKDIRRSKTEGKRRLAIVFVVPYNRGKRIDGLDGKCQWAINELIKLNVDAYAWTFPCLGKFGKYKDKNSSGICPGIAILIKEV